MRFLVFAGATALLIGAAHAQPIPSAEDGSHLALDAPSAVKRPRPAAGLRLESTEVPSGAAAIALSVASVQVTGSTVYSEAELAKLTANLVGHHSLADIYQLAAKLTQRYGADGYALSRVVVPPQDIDPAAAHIVLQAVEGYVDQVVWPEGVSRYRDVFADYTRAITSDRPIRVRTLERYLLLAGDLPGLNVSSRLEPSPTHSGASTLVIEMTEKLVDGGVWLDNWGTEGRGPVQYRLDGAIGNVLGLHERLAVTYGGSAETSELQYLTASLSFVLNAEGTLFSVKGTASGGAPNTPDLTAIEYENRSYALSAELSHPLIRSREQNLTLSGQVFASDDSSQTLGVPFSDDRLRGVRVAASYDQLDSWGGFSQGFVQFSKGFVGAGSTSNDNPLASRDAGQVDFAKLEFRVSRDQDLGAAWSLFSGVSGQYALTPLLAPEECSYGGRSFGRAFDSGALAGDHCASGIVELRYNLAPTEQLSAAQLYGFIDAGAIWRIAPAIGTTAHETGGSAGAGVRTTWADTVQVNADLTYRLWGPDDAAPWRGRLSVGMTY